jgi:hypothetical protein
MEDTLILNGKPKKKEEAMIRENVKETNEKRQGQCDDDE